MNESRRNMLKNLMGGAAAISASPLLTSFDISNDKTSSLLKETLTIRPAGGVTILFRWKNSAPLQKRSD
jgi:hypothetical protein